MSLFAMYNSEFDSKDSDKIAEKKKNKMVAECRKGSNIILTTEFLGGQEHQIPLAGEARHRPAVFRADHRKIRNSNNWFLFVGSDTAPTRCFTASGYGIFYYCGHLIPGSFNAASGTKAKPNTGPFASTAAITEAKTFSGGWSTNSAPGPSGSRVARPGRKPQLKIRCILKEIRIFARLCPDYCIVGRPPALMRRRRSCEREAGFRTES